MSAPAAAARRAGVVRKRCARVVRKVPRPTGSIRRLSEDRLEDEAAQLARMAGYAARQYRPLGWLAVVAFGLDRQRPRGASRCDARSNVLVIAACQAASANWASGRGAMPGRQVTAGVAGRAERTVTRHWAVLERLGCAAKTVEGDVLSKVEHDELAADDDERERWRHRQQWDLVFPDWLAEVSDAELWPYVERVAPLLAELGMRIMAVDEPADGAVDNRPGQGANSGSVTPSLDLGVLGSVPLIRRSSFSRRPAVDKPPAPHRSRSRKGHKGGASRHSPTREAPGTSCKSVLGRSGGVTPPRAREIPADVLVLARQVAADARLPFVRGREMHRVCGVLLRLPGWTVDDVVAEAEQRLAECGKAMCTRVNTEAGYLDWLLKHAVPGEPPAQIAQAMAEQVRAATAERIREQRAAADAQAARARYGPDRSAAGELAALRARTSDRLRRPDLAAYLDTTTDATDPARTDGEHHQALTQTQVSAQRAAHEPLSAQSGTGPAAVRADRAGLAARPNREPGDPGTSGGPAETWPQTAQPGFGLPPDWRRGADQDDPPGSPDCSGKGGLPG